MNSILQLSTDVVGYQSIKEWLDDELLVLDVRLEYALDNIVATGKEQAALFSGQYFSSDAAYALLNEQEYGQLELEQRMLLEQLEERIAARVAQSAALGFELPVKRLRAQFELTSSEWRALIVCFAPHYRAKYWRLYGFVHDDMTRQSVSLQLLLLMCCHTPQEYYHMLEQMLDPATALRQLLVDGVPVAGDDISVLKQPLTLHPTLIGYIQGLHVDQEIVGMHYYNRQQLIELEPLLIDEHLQQKLQRYVTEETRQRTSPKYGVVISLYGKSGSGKTLQSQHVARFLQQAYIEVDLSCAPTSLVAFRTYMEQILLEAQIKQALLVFDQLASLIEADKADSGEGVADSATAIQGIDGTTNVRWNWLLERMKRFAAPIFVHSKERLSGMMQRVQPIEVRLAAPTMEQSSMLWQQLTKREKFADLSKQEADRLAAKFRFSPGQMVSAISLAVKENSWQQAGVSEGAEVGMWLHQAAYRSIHHQLSLQANKMEHTFSWSDLILPEESLYLLQQACHRMKDRYQVMQEWGFEHILPYGRGISMMFTGPPGTGKTMSALIMAKEMDAELYRVDLSRVVSKYIGETEKNLRAIFDQAQQSGAILFFDEADALFGKRSEVKDAHDKYANMETAFLLQKMEEYDGLTILASNLSQHLDEAFMRRIQFIIKFPFPDKQQREQLWRSAIPQHMQNETIDFTFLAETFELSGGPIKNIILTAAYLAAHEQQSTIEMKHFVEAAIQEYKKSGKLLLRDRLGVYGQYWRG
ncbi:AAA family ATPase [Paenibacillus yanchengensis]|uniref:AAA family ATPase n=1 Tax=Paenibacillus yanchengensis TaxID=2035833 RepID=A0ABW4YEP5_9BACL